MTTAAARSGLHTSLDDVPGLPAATLKMLNKEGFTTVGDLLLHLPARHEDRRRMDFKGFAPSLEPVCHHVRVVRARTVRFGRRAGFFEAEVEAAQGNPLHQQLTLRWFNMPFMNRVIAVDMELMIYGKIKEMKGRLVMGHPEYEMVRGDEDDEGAQIHTGRIVPVYRLRGGLKQKPLRAALWHVLEHFDARGVVDLLPPPKTDGEFAGLHRGKALLEGHFPVEMVNLERARRYLALEEFYVMQLRVLRRRAQWRSVPTAQHAQAGGQLERTFMESLTFVLTAAQRRCLDEILHDVDAARPMNRLLHGDVGSGKTVVALAAMLHTIEGGRQAALMAPTQILAEQHHANARRWLEPLGVRVALRTGDKQIEASTEDLFFTVKQSSSQETRSARVPRAVSGVTPETSEPAVQGSGYSKRRLPHFERPWGKYMLTFSTLDRKPLSLAERDVVLQAALYFNRVRYQLFAAVVMPDHVHLLLEPFPESKDEKGPIIFWALSKIIHSIKSFTAHRINNLRGTKGEVWDKETFDTLMRNEEQLQERFLYIVGNPREAGLVEEDENYPWLWTWEGVPRDAEHGMRDARSPARPENGDPMKKPTSWRETDGPHLIIGTHALLHDREALPRLGLVVIDEQHKFGVAQRARLMARGERPDVLVMTATPIPRTLALTVYGDLDVSTIDEKPSARGVILTRVQEQKSLRTVVKFVNDQLMAGRQAYIVFPLIDESDTLDAGAALTGLKEWTEHLKPHAVGLLHGRMAAEEKDAVMRRFRAGEIKALVSTTVIEVGVDVPNATVMLIHNAERFGLAQLHQLRGRIGRGTHESHCVLFMAGKDPEVRQRLQIMEETCDGFRIAEEDLRRRGPGDLLGQAQSGQAPLRFAELLADTRLLTLARRLAERTLKADPALEKPEHAALKALLAADTQEASALQ